MEPFSSNKHTCFECKKIGYIKVGYPIYQKKQQRDKKNKGSFKKKKKVYVALDDDESTTSSNNSEEDQAKSCLMANNEAESEVTISDSKNWDVTMSPLIFVHIRLKFHYFWALYLGLHNVGRVS